MEEEYSNTHCNTYTFMPMQAAQHPLYSQDNSHYSCPPLFFGHQQQQQPMRLGLNTASNHQNLFVVNQQQLPNFVGNLDNHNSPVPQPQIGHNIFSNPFLSQVPDTGAANSKNPFRQACGSPVQPRENEEYIPENENADDDDSDSEASYEDEPMDPNYDPLANYEEYMRVRNQL